MQELTWSLRTVWNQQVASQEKREMVRREHIWASEVGGSYPDRFLKMSGVAPTNPPNDRSLRKFMAGNLWEWVVQMVLRQAGILIECQERLEYQYPGLLKVTGKLDFLAGGVPSWDKAASEMSLFPPELRHVSAGIVEQLRETFGDEPLKELVVEIKSVASTMFGQYEKGIINSMHRNQVFHYLKSKGLDEGLICCISKDDCKMAEFGVFNPSNAELPYRLDIETMTDYWTRQEMPPLEPFIVFENGKFKLNWKITYSNYLTKLYGYGQPADFSENSEWAARVPQWNSTLKRCVDGANMTKLNLERIADAKRYFPSWDVMVDQARAYKQEHPDEAEETPEKA